MQLRLRGVVIMRHIRSLAICIAMAAASSAAAQPGTQTITVSSFSFAPRPIHLTAGQSVTLTFVNRSGGGHDFTAKTFFAASRITAGAVPNGEIELGGHQTKSITLVPARGTYTAHCSHFMHTQMGMSDEIVVD
jgi:plastocyanin